MFDGGQAVVKAQQPLVLDSVALDLLLMRRFAVLCRTFPQVMTVVWSCEVETG